MAGNEIHHLFVSVPELIHCTHGLAGVGRWERASSLDQGKATGSYKSLAATSPWS